MPFAQRAGGAGVRVLEFVREPCELLERARVVGLPPRLAHPALIGGRSRSGRWPHHVALLVPQAALHGDLAEHRADGLAQRLRPVDHEQHPLLGIEAPLDQIGEQRGRDGRVLRRSFPEPERDLHALGGDPRARRSSSGPSARARRASSPPSADLQSWRLISSPSASRVRSTNVRDTADFDVDRALVSTSSPTGSCVRRYRRVETPASIRSSTTRPSGSRSAKCSIGLQAAPRPRRPRSAPADARPRRDGRRASPHHPRGHAGPPSDPRSTCPSGRRHRRPPPPSTRSTHRARRRRSARAIPPSLPRPAAPNASCTRSGSTPSCKVASATGTLLLTAVPP